VELMSVAVQTDAENGPATAEGESIWAKDEN
jgi:hypothetical protein